MTIRGPEFDAELRTPRARFQGQGLRGIAVNRRRDAHRARRFYAGICALVAFVAVALTIVRLAQGTAPGAWTALYLAGGVINGCGVPLARLGRTRWAFGAMCVGAGVAMVGDGPMFW